MDFNYTYPQINTYSYQTNDEDNDFYNDDLMSFERIHNSQDMFREDELLKENEPENYRIYGYDDDDLPLANSITEGLRAKVLPFDYTPRSISNAYKEFDIEQQQQPFFRYCKIRTKNGYSKPSHILFDIATKLNDNTDKWGEEEKDIMSLLKHNSDKYDKQNVSRFRTSRTYSMLHKGYSNKEILEVLKNMEENTTSKSKKNIDEYMDSYSLNDFERRYNKYSYEFDYQDEEYDDYANEI